MSGSRWLVVLTAVVGISIAGHDAPGADYTNTSSVLDGSGRWSGGGAYANISACAQPGGIAMSSAGNIINYAGFLGSFSLRPGLDTDGDGLANELDPDNDNDELADGDEVTGVTFDPITATDPDNPDSDDDGMSDGEEAVTGTDPTDETMYLHITDIRVDPSPQRAIVTWQARGGRTYDIYGTENLLSDWPPVLLDQVAAAGGSPPWFKTSASYTNLIGPATSRFYRVGVQE